MLEGIGNNLLRMGWGGGSAGGRGGEGGVDVVAYSLFPLRAVLVIKEENIYLR